MNPWKTSLLALALLLATPALAQDAAPPAATVAAESPGFIDAARMDALEKMTPDERHDFFKQRHEKFKNLTEEEKTAHKEKRKAWFDALPEAEKAALKERSKKMHEQRKADRKAWFDALPEEEKAAHKAKWEERKKAHMQKCEKDPAQCKKMHKGMPGGDMHDGPAPAKK